MRMRIHRLTGGAAWAIVLIGVASTAHGQEDVLANLARRYDADVRPLATKFCGDCHSPDLAEAEIDLVSIDSLAKVRKNPQVWQKVAEMLASGQMPPKESPQPSDAERAKLREWVQQYLKEEAKLRAGDPGPVVLRRLSNAQYTYVLRDLTGVAALDPAREFPVDGAAGEGFTNTGSGLVMSPALLAKYLDAAKSVSDHAVLLPDGIRFSPSTSRRDWTEEALAEIRGIYAKYADGAGGTQVNLQGIVFDTNGGGRLPLARYFGVLISEREAIASGSKSIEAVAREQNLSPKYLASLWTLLTAKRDGEPSLLVDSLRERFAKFQPADAAASSTQALADEVTRWQQSLWKFNSVGHIGKVGGPKSWMEDVQPIAPRMDIRLKLAADAGSPEQTVYLVATDAGDGPDRDTIVWNEPRLVAAGKPDILLRDVRRITQERIATRQKLFASSAKSLAVATEVSRSPDKVDVTALAAKHGVEPALAAAWLAYLGIGDGQAARIQGHFTDKIGKASGYDFVSGWGRDETPLLVANSSDQHVRIPGNMAPHSVAVHPSPSMTATVGWRSPVAGEVQVVGLVQHAHPECGNGVTWSLELRRGSTRQRLADGISHGAAEVAVGPIEKLTVKPGDVVSLVVGPRDTNHSCDLTRVDLSLTNVADAKQAWSLSADVSGDVLAGNPHADRLGNKEVWHFYSEPVGGSVGPVIPAGSVLARWQAAADAGEQSRLAEEVQQLLLAGPPADANSPDAALVRQVGSLGGPLLSAVQPADEKPSDIQGGAVDWGLDPALFGRHPSDPKAAVAAASLCVQAPSTIAIRLPTDLVAGYELVTSGMLHESGREGSVQLFATASPPAEAKSLLPGLPIVVGEGTAARRRMEASLAEFRRHFPAALCYAKIVPVDEVVTLTLYYREDHELSRLMLDDAEAARLERLWDELHYVSQDALTLVDAYAQLMEYATQDADPKVFEPLRKPIADRAAAYRQRLVDTEPQHQHAVLAFAEKAYRRPLTDDENQQLRSLYQSLRTQELPHDEAIRLTLARVLVAPAFLYRAEHSQPGNKPTSVSPTELAGRLSFFLWSSVPDAELTAAAASGKLQTDAEIIAQTRRMLKDPRTRRLAEEFATQWLHIYDFASHDEKSTEAFPTFAAVREPMYEESIRSFTDLVQRDGSILELVDSDTTFLNEQLAKHYDIPGVSGGEWRRVAGVKEHGRGGILALAQRSPSNPARRGPAPFSAATG